jgi:photosystem II stability/assembly factor-like uncharacterized protein
MRRLIASIAIGASLLALSACGQRRTNSPQGARTSPDVVHIHELGVNPEDGSIIVATHVGLFSAALDKTRLRRVGDARQDTMGLAILASDRFLGSGHAGRDPGSPSSLGLIRSDDAGRTWRPIAMAGRADFHVLRAANRHLFGVDADDGRLLVSDDEGATWARRFPPAPLVDLVIRPGHDERVLASAEMMLFASDDGGRSWRAASLERAGLLAWPRDEALYVIDSRGVVYRSEDAGESWRRMGRVGGKPVAFGAYESELFVALRDDSIHMSFDGGRTWVLRAKG